MIDRSIVHKSEKLDKLVSAFVDEPEKEHSDFPSNHLDVAGVILYEDEDTDFNVEYGVGIAMKCPADLAIFSGTDLDKPARYFVYARDEDHALEVWTDAVTRARETARNTRHREF